MLWFKEHKRNWRVFFLAMLALAIFGPWFFDRVSVPLPYTCSPPYIRLDDDFCGIPISITWLLREIPSLFSYLISGLISGDHQSYATREWLVLLFSIFVILPFLSTPIVIKWEKQTFHRVSLGLAAGTGLLIGILARSLSIVSWMLWGAWLYVFLTAGLLVMEIVAAPKTIDISAEKL